MIGQDGVARRYEYGPAGRLQDLKDANGNVMASYAYDATGRLVRKDNGNGTYTVYQYDSADQIEHLVNYAPDGAVNSRFDYTYDSLGRQKSMATLDGQWTYSYDPTGQLARAVFASNNPNVV